MRVGGGRMTHTMKSFRNVNLRDIQEEIQPTIGHTGLETSKRYRLSSRWRIIHTRVTVSSICSEYILSNTWLDKLSAMGSHLKRSSIEFF